MKLFFITLLSALVISVASMAQDSGKELAQITFSSTDNNEDNELDFTEISEMTMKIAISMDSNEDFLIDQSEFLDWDFGFHYLAESKGDTDNYLVVKRIMFAVQDLNSDNKIDLRELRINTSWSFTRADLNNDRVLSEIEYLKAWMPILMMKAGNEG